MSKAQILDHVWQYDFGGDGGVVETYIGYLRRKVDNVDPRLIHTIRGVGYTLREQQARCRSAPASCSGMALVAVVLVVAAIVITRTTEANLVDQVDAQLAARRRAAGCDRTAAPAGRPDGGPTGLSDALHRRGRRRRHGRARWSRPNLGDDDRPLPDDPPRHAVERPPTARAVHRRQRRLGRCATGRVDRGTDARDGRGRRGRACRSTTSTPRSTGSCGSRSS